MIEYLEQLVKDGKYQEALKVAEQVLAAGVTDPVQLVAVNVAIVEAHCWLQNWDAVLVPGDLVLRLAREIGDWDRFGTTAINVSTAYSRLGQHETAIERIYQYIVELPNYSHAASHEGLAWFNLGTFNAAIQRPLEASKALSRALRATERLGNLRQRHGIRQALVEAYLRSGELEPIPRLLAQCAHYLRSHPDAHMWRDSWVFHMELRAEFALATGRVHRARAVAVRGLEQTEGSPEAECRFHLLLSTAALRTGTVKEALDHGVSARAYAVFLGRRDLEAEADELIHSVSRVRTETI